MFRFILSVILVAFAALAQLTNYVFVGSIKPNFALVIILLFSLVYKDWLRRAIFIFLAALFLKFGSGVEIQNILFIISSFLGIFMLDKIPSIKLVNLILAVIAGTLTVNIINFEVWRVIMETFYNLAIALSLFIIYRIWLGKYERN